MFAKFVLTCIIVEASYPTETPHHERNLQQYQQPAAAKPDLLKELLALIQGGLDSLNIGNDFFEPMKKLVKQMEQMTSSTSLDTLLQINNDACKLFCDTTADGCTMMPNFAALAMNNLAVTCSGSASPVGIRFDDPNEALENLDIAKLLAGESFIHWTCPNSQSSDYGSEEECRPGWLNALIPSQHPACSTCSTASANVAPVSDRVSESTTTTTTTTNNYNQALKEEEEVENVSSTTTIVVIIVVVVVVVVLLIILTVCVLMNNSSKREANMKKKPDLSKAQGPPAGKKSESKTYRGAGLE